MLLILAIFRHTSPAVSGSGVASRLGEPWGQKKGSKKGVKKGVKSTFDFS